MSGRCLCAPPPASPWWEQPPRGELRLSGTVQLYCSSKSISENIRHGCPWYSILIARYHMYRCYQPGMVVLGLLLWLIARYHTYRYYQPGMVVLGLLFWLIAWYHVPVLPAKHGVLGIPSWLIALYPTYRYYQPASFWCQSRCDFAFWCGSWSGSGSASYPTLNCSHVGKSKFFVTFI